MASLKRNNRGCAAEARTSPAHSQHRDSASYQNGDIVATVAVSRNAKHIGERAEAVTKRDAQA